MDTVNKEAKQSDNQVITTLQKLMINMYIIGLNDGIKIGEDRIIKLHDMDD